MPEITWPIYILIAIIVAAITTFVLTYVSKEDEPDTFITCVGIFSGLFWFAAIPAAIVTFVFTWLFGYVAAYAIYLRKNGLPKFKKPVQKVNIHNPNLKWDGDISFRSKT